MHAPERWVTLAYLEQHQPCRQPETQHIYPTQHNGERLALLGRRSVTECSLRLQFLKEEAINFCTHSAFTLSFTPTGKSLPLPCARVTGSWITAVPTWKDTHLRKASSALYRHANHIVIVYFGENSTLIHLSADGTATPCPTVPWQGAVLFLKGRN